MGARLSPDAPERQIEPGEHLPQLLFADPPGPLCQACGGGVRHSPARQGQYQLVTGGELLLLLKEADEAVCCL